MIDYVTIDMERSIADLSDAVSKCEKVLPEFPIEWAKITDKDPTYIRRFVNLIQSDLNHIKDSIHTIENVLDYIEQDFRNIIEKD